MGHLKEKYTREYFLGAVDEATGLAYGADGRSGSGQLHPRYNRLLPRRHLKGKIILDVGCGRGEVVDYCARNGAREVIGIDFSEAATQLASELNKDNLNVKLKTMEAISLDFENTFDIIFALDVIEHIPDGEMQIVYARMHSALKEKGFTVLHTPIFKSMNDKDESDSIPAVSGMHCNKQTLEKLNRDLLNHRFRRYSFNVWGKSVSFSLENLNTFPVLFVSNNDLDTSFS